MSKFLSGGGEERQEVSEWGRRSGQTHTNSRRQEVTADIREAKKPDPTIVIYVVFLQAIFNIGKLCSALRPTQLLTQGRAQHTAPHQT